MVTAIEGYLHKLSSETFLDWRKQRCSTGKGKDEDATALVSDARFLASCG